MGDIEDVHIILFKDSRLPELRAAYKEAVNNAINRGKAVLVHPGHAADPTPDDLTSHGHGHDDADTVNIQDAQHGHGHDDADTVNIQDAQPIGEASAEGLPVTAKRPRPSDVEATEAALGVEGVDDGDTESGEGMIGAGAGQSSWSVSS